MDGEGLNYSPLKILDNSAWVFFGSTFIITLFGNTLSKTKISQAGQESQMIRQVLNELHA